MAHFVQRPSLDGVPVLELVREGAPLPGDVAVAALEQGRYDAARGVYRPHLFAAVVHRQVYDQGWNDGRRRVPNVGEIGPTLLALTASGAWPPRPIEYLPHDTQWRPPRPARVGNPSSWTVTTIPLAPPGFRV